MLVLESVSLHLLEVLLRVCADLHDGSRPDHVCDELPLLAVPLEALQEDQVLLLLPTACLLDEVLCVGQRRDYHRVHLLQLLGHRDLDARPSERVGSEAGGGHGAGWFQRSLCGERVSMQSELARCWLSREVVVLGLVPDWSSDRELQLMGKKQKHPPDAR